MADTPRDENPAAAFDPAESVSPLGGGQVSGGTLPTWFLQAVVGG